MNTRIGFPELRAIRDPKTPAEVNLDKLADEIRRPPEQYIPAAHRTKDLGRLTVTGVKNFADLPTKQIDNLIEAMETKVAQIKAKAEAIKSDYAERTAELTASIERLNEACIQSETKMEELHEQLNELYKKQPVAKSVPPEGDLG